MWVRVGGGMESVPDRRRHGPADAAFPPPGGPWEPLALSGRLVGWGERGGLAAALEAASVSPKERARGVVLGAVIGVALPNAISNLPADAAVIASEPSLVEAFTRAGEWLGGEKLTVGAEAAGAWWKVSVCTEADPPALAVPEMGEPLLRLIVDTHLDGWLDSSEKSCAHIYLPARSPR